MGSVWLAEDRILRRTVALKELVPHVSTLNLAESRERALVEARAMARVNHPAIVGIHDLFFTGADPWIVMEYIRGRSLAAIIRDQSLDERAIAAIGLRILSGLCAVHDAKIVHRDVKPENIVVGADDEIVLVDFGIAKISGDIRLTARSTVLGTTEYMAPERILGDPVGPAADLWSLGVTLFHALEGYSPFLRDGEPGPGPTIAAVLRDDPPRPARPRLAPGSSSGCWKRSRRAAVRRGSRRSPRVGPRRPRRGQAGADPARQVPAAASRAGAPTCPAPARTPAAAHSGRAGMPDLAGSSRAAGGAVLAAGSGGSPGDDPERRRGGERGRADGHDR